MCCQILLMHNASCVNGITVVSETSSSEWIAFYPKETINVFCQTHLPFRHISLMVICITIVLSGKSVLSLTFCII